MREEGIVVIGAGAGGLVVAIGATKAGKKVLLIERGTWGGDCTNFGCIPSKTLIAAAEEKDPKALERVRRVVGEVRSHEDAAALEKMGVNTLTGAAKFLDPHTLEVNGERIWAKKIVIAAGSSPMIPEIEGLEGTPYLTNEMIFDLKEIPKSLAILGGGPIGCELAQAFRRLGCDVTLIHRHPNLLKKEDPEAQAVIAEQFEKEGVHLHLEASPQKVSHSSGKFTITTDKGVVSADQFLVSVGRVPNVMGLGLDAAGVKWDKKGISIDKFGRTTQKHIFALGDVVGGPQFTHWAENQGRTILTTLLLPGPFKKKLSKQPLPRVTYTDPEVASFGPQEGPVTYKVPFTEVDRAITADRTEGFVKVATKKWSSKILGATIVGPRAGEMLPELSVAAYHKIPLRKLASVIHPYPTYSLGIRRAGDFWLTQTFLPGLKNLFKGFSFKRILPLLIILVLMITAYALGLHKYVTFEMLKEQHDNLQAFVGKFPISAPIIYMCVYAVAISLSLPGGAVLSLLGGFLFGIPLSTLYVLVGATTGASVIFMAAKTGLGEPLQKRAGPFLKKMEKGFRKNAWSYLLFLRFIPLFPFWLVNIAPAFFGVSFVTYLWTTFVGIIPGAYVYTQTGSGLAAIFAAGGEFSIGAILNWQLRLALIALALFALIPIFVKRYLEKRKHL